MEQLFYTESQAALAVCTMIQHSCVERQERRERERER